jgi:hypothetical protein
MLLKRKGRGLAVAAVLVVLLTGCRGFKRLTTGEKDVQYIPMTPDFVTVDLIRDPVTFADKRYNDAKYLAVEICDAAGVCVPLPFVHPSTKEMATYLRDGSYITFVGHETAMPKAVTGKIQYVLQ